MAAEKKAFAEALLDDPRTDVSKGGRVVMPATHYPQPNGGVIDLPDPLEVAKLKGYTDLEARIRERMKTQTSKKPKAPRAA